MCVCVCGKCVYVCDSFLRSASCMRVVVGLAVATVTCPTSVEVASPRRDSSGASELCVKLMYDSRDVS